MTAGAVVKYLAEQNSTNSIDSLSQILEGLKLCKVRKVKGLYYVFIKLYSIEGHISTIALPFSWSHRHKPSVKEGIMLSKSQFKLESMMRRNHV